jgi:predicted amidohydrolase YtcJ
VETTVFENGTVRAGGSAPDRSRLVVRGGVVLPHDIPIPSDAERVDLRGGLVLPAFADGHAHPLLAGRETFGPRLRDARTVDVIVERVRRWAAEDDSPWLIGGSYDATIAPDGLFDAAWLDRAEATRPVVLHAWDYHTAWVNTAALTAAGIERMPGDPPSGRIVRRPDGTAMGTLIERPAIDLVLDEAPRPSLHRDVEALIWASEALAARGITWVQEAWTELHDVDAWVAAAASGRMRTDADLAFRADPGEWPGQLERMIAASRRLETVEGLTGRTVKFFVDGIIENRTAHLLADYHDACGHGAPNWEPAALADAVRAADAAGFHVHLHAIGDAAIRSALTAVEAREPGTPRRATLAHVQVIHPDDLARLADLDVTLCFQPSWAVPDDVMVDLTLPRLGPERAVQYRLRSALDAGARISFGSDWPVTPPDVLTGIRTAVTRADAHGDPAGGWHPEERLTIDQALDAATSGVHHQSGTENDQGTLAPGSAADLVWLDRDIRSGPAARIADANILGTWRRGHRTYSPSPAAQHR